MKPNQSVKRCYTIYTSQTFKRASIWVLGTFLHSLLQASETDWVPTAQLCSRHPHVKVRMWAMHNETIQEVAAWSPDHMLPVKMKIFLCHPGFIQEAGQHIDHLSTPMLQCRQGRNPPLHKPTEALLLLHPRCDRAILIGLFANMFFRR
eukprot:2313451-Amphidinium_carterae.1